MEYKWQYSKKCKAVTFDMFHHTPYKAKYHRALNYIYISTAFLHPASHTPAADSIIDITAPFPFIPSGTPGLLQAEKRRPITRLNKTTTDTTTDQPGSLCSEEKGSRVEQHFREIQTPKVKNKYVHEKKATPSMSVDRGFRRA